MTVRVENRGDIPVGVDIHGFSWDEIAEIEQWIADAQKNIDDPTWGNDGFWKKMKHRRVDLLETIRRRGLPHVVGMFEITDIRTKKTYMADKTASFCGTARQFAPMPPGAAVSRKFEFEPGQLLPEGGAGDVGITFLVFGSVDGTRETIANSNQLRVSVLAAEGQPAK